MMHTPRTIYVRSLVRDSPIFQDQRLCDQILSRGYLTAASVTFEVSTELPTGGRWCPAISDRLLADWPALLDAR
jgi:hypothetical protein